MVKQSRNLINNLIDNVMMFVFVIMCVSIGCLLPDFQYVKISIGALSAHHNVASFLRCRRKFLRVYCTVGFLTWKCLLRQWTHF